MFYLVSVIIGGLMLSVNSTSFDRDHKIWSKCDANDSCSCGSDIGRVNCTVSW